MSNCRVALVGLGYAATALHLPALAGIASASVIGAFDRDPVRCERAAERWGLPVFDDFDEMIDSGRPDVVIVATPPDSHAGYCLRCLAAGAHVICEKPFVSNLQEADRVIQAAAAAGRRVALNHEFREMPIFRAVRDAVDRSPWPGAVFAQVWQSIDLPPWTEPGWRGQIQQRTLYEAGVHLVDLLVALFRQKPVTVSAALSSGGVRAGEADAVALATLEFTGNRLAQVVQNRLSKGETQYFELRVDTREASLRASFGGRARVTAGFSRSIRPHLRIDYGLAGLAWKEVGNRRTFLARNPRNAVVLATRSILQQTLTAFAEDTPPPISAEDGRDILEVVVACYHAAAAGRRIRLDRAEAPELAGLHLGMAQLP